MAKIGLSLGEKIDIGGKEYRILNDLVDVKELLGDLTFISVNGVEMVYEEVRQPDGRMGSVMTDEVRGVDISVRSSLQEQPYPVLVMDMLPHQVEELGIGFLEAIELEDIVVAYCALGREDVYKIFASNIKKKNAGNQKHEKKAEQKQDNHQHHQQ